MFKFSIAEIIILVTTVAVAAAGIGRPHEGGNAWTVVAAVLIGLAIAGPPILWWRLRKGELTGLWGLGEIAWLSLGLYFLPLVVWCIVVPGAKAHADDWLLAGVIFALSIFVVALLLRGSRGLVRVLGGQTSGRRWFVPRGTNLLGLAVLILMIAIGMVFALRFFVSL
jgi:hypothetical protein